MNIVRVDYGGMGGSCEGIRQAGYTPIGFEWDKHACATRAANNHLTVRCDLTQYRTPPHNWGGYWASPPCQTFSKAGRGNGIKLLDTIHDAILKQKWGAAETIDSRSRHIIDCTRTAVELQAPWIVFEQVPSVLPVWETVGFMLEQYGYMWWAGVLNAADYGVPQTRKRAFMIASKTSQPYAPTPTHAKHPGMLGELPWVSMADALGPGFQNKILKQHQDNSHWIFTRPSTTLCGDRRIGEPGYKDMKNGAPQFKTQCVRITVEEALILQGFPHGTKLRGGITSELLQIGNAVPPPLSKHIVESLRVLDTPNPT